MTSILKACTKCKQAKPLSEFYKRKDRPSEVWPQCKECKKAAQRQVSRRWYWDKMEGDRPKPNYDMENRRAYYRAVRASRLRANDVVNKAVARGQIPPVKDLACSRCGKPASHYHHYLGYEPEHYLDVEPVCTVCHGLERRK